MPKRARINGIKSYRCYTPAEAAALVGVSTKTVRNWAKNGLPIMDCERPALIRGDDLRAYLKKQRQSKKIETGLCEFYCVRCRASNRPLGNLADCILAGHRATLKALCGICENAVSKPIALVRLSEIRETLDVAITGDDCTL